MVQAAPLPFGDAMPKRKVGTLPIMAMALLACAALLAASHFGGSQTGPVELDRSHFLYLLQCLLFGF